MTIECLYGQMKRRFPLLSHGLRFRKPADSARCIITIAVLHNISKRNYDSDFEGRNETHREDAGENTTVQSSSGIEKRDLIAGNL